MLCQTCGVSDIDALRVSAVVATFGRPDLLRSFLRKLLADPGLDEVVAVLDGTEDASLDVAAELASRDARLKPLWVSHRGQFGALDAGIRAASGEVVWLLDDDVVPTPGLADGHRAAHRGTTGLVALGYMPVGNRPPPTTADVATVLYAWEYEARCRHYEEDPDTVLHHLWGGNLSMRRSDYLALPPTRLVAPPHLDSARLYHQDRELGLRCLEAGMRGTFDRRLLAVHEHQRTPGGFLRDAFGRGVCEVVIGRLHPRHAAPPPAWPLGRAAQPLLNATVRGRTLVALRTVLDGAVASGSWRLTETTAKATRRVAHGLGVVAATRALADVPDLPAPAARRPADRTPDVPDDRAGAGTGSAPAPTVARRSPT